MYGTVGENEEERSNLHIQRASSRERFPGSRCEHLDIHLDRSKLLKLSIEKPPVLELQLLHTHVKYAY